MGPANTHSVVAPIPVDPERKVFGVDRGEIEDVPSSIRGQRQAIARTRPSLHNGLHVREVVRKIEHRLEEHVEIGAARRHAIPDVGMPQGVGHALGQPSTDGDPTRQQRDRTLAAEFPLSGITLDLEHR